MSKYMLGRNKDIAPPAWVVTFLLKKMFFMKNKKKGDCFIINPKVPGKEHKTH